MRRPTRWLVATLGLVAASAGRPAPAQLTPMPAPGTTGPAPGSAMFANPAMNPALNPYANPMLGTQDPRLARDAALLFLLHRQAQGGIGSGRLANGPGPRAATTNRAPSQMSPTAMVPGSGASRYFNAGQGAANQMNSYYNRHDRVVNSGRR